MAFSCGFFNAKGLDRTYTAENFCDYLGSLICNGIQDNFGEQFNLTAPETGLKVILGTGKAWIDGHYFISDSRYSIDLSEHLDESLPRYVAIAIVCDKSESVRKVQLEIIPGTPAENPSIPQIPTDENRKRLLLYAIRLNVGRENLTNADWFDCREDANVCGYCKCILGKCKVTEMQAQIAQLIAEMSKYNKIIAGLTNKIDELQIKVNDLTSDVVEAGQCGENIYYVLYSNGKLLLRGTGETYDYQASGFTANTFLSPFLNHEKIKSVVFSDGITSAGDFLFEFCDNLETVSFPNTLAKIGHCSFMPHLDSSTTPQTALGLKTLILPDGITEIEKAAFAGTRLTELTIPKSIETVGDYAFESCINLKKVRYEGKIIGGFMFVKCFALKEFTIASTCTEISSHCFNYCSNLREITYEGGLEAWDKVTKRTNWDGHQGQSETPLTKIQCYDGFMQWNSDSRKWEEVKENA